jgi:transcription initiation factor IIE alpha subunit
MRYLTYPKRRRMDDAEIIQWARDRMIDNRIEALGGDIEASYFAAEQQTPKLTVDEAMAKLEADGVAKFQR